MPLKATAVVPVKLVPAKVTVVPAAPLVGVKAVIVGAGVALKRVELVAVPAGVVTLIGPVVTPMGASVAIDVSLTIQLAAR